MNLNIDLNTIWFILVGVLIIGYAILDGFDLGVGSLYYLLGKTDDEKKVLIQSVGPFWDGNEVWLLTGGGALFAAFPMVYASVFSGFYLAMILVLFGLIFRAVAVEFRNKVDSEKWHNTWDLLFFLGSLLPALLFGVAIGNIAKGLPLGDGYYYTGSFFGLLNPYALLIGLLGLFAFLMQGVTYSLLKTEGIIQQRARKLFIGIWSIFILLYVLATMYSYFSAHALFNNFFSKTTFFVIPALTIIGMLVTPLSVWGKKYGTSFLFSSITVATMILTLAVGMFPNLVPALDPSFSLNIYNSASSHLTLKTMLVIAASGVPIMLFYTAYVYWVFRGKVKLEQGGY